MWRPLNIDQPFEGHHDSGGPNPTLSLAIQYLLLVDILSGQEASGEKNIQKWVSSQAPFTVD